MEQRTAFITGASSGIGLALAQELGQRGVRVALCARREDRLQELARSIRSAGGQADVYAFDASEPAAVQETLLRADDELGGIDLVIANAGVAKPRRAHKLRWEELDEMMNVNVRGATATLTTLIPRMLERGGGHLVGVSSLGGRRPVPPMVTYTATKAYLSHLLEGLKIELAPRGITVTDVQPGYVESGLNEGHKGSMPFIMPATQAATIISDGIAARRPIVAFPWQMDSITRALGALPSGLYSRAAKHLT